MSNDNLSPLRGPADVNKSWLSKMLTQFFTAQCEVTHYQVSSPTQKEGYLSEISFVNVTFTSDENEQNENLVMKFLPLNNEKKSFISDGLLSEREVKFYELSKSEEFKTALIKNGNSHIIPCIFFCKLEKECMTLVMEDLNYLRYKTVVEKEGLDLARVLVSLEGIAVIHAAGLFYFNKKGHFGMKKYTNTTYMEELVSPNLLFIMKYYDENDDIRRVLQSLLPFSGDIASAHLNVDFFDTIIHGDFWAGQCMFSNDGQKICILDWQFSSVGNPIVDLMGMFFMTCDSSLLETKLYVMLRHYWLKFMKCIQEHEIQLPVTSSYDRFLECVEDLWICGFGLLAATITDFIENDVITEKRTKGLISFLYSRNVFSKFISKVTSSRISKED